MQAHGHWELGFQSAQEANDLLMVVPRIAIRDYAAIALAKRGDQAGSSVPLVLVRTFRSDQESRASPVETDPTLGLGSSHQRIGLLRRWRLRIGPRNIRELLCSEGIAG